MIKVKKYSKCPSGKVIRELRDCALDAIGEAIDFIYSLYYILSRSISKLYHGIATFLFTKWYASLNIFCINHDWSVNFRPQHSASRTSNSNQLWHGLNPLNRWLR